MATQDEKFHDLEDDELLRQSRQNLQQPPKTACECDPAKNWRPIAFMLLFASAVGVGIAIGFRFRENDDNSASYINGYSVSSSHAMLDNGGEVVGYRLFLNCTDGAAQYGPDIQQLVVDIEFEDLERVRVRITDVARTRYTVPNFILPDATAPIDRPSKDAVNFVVTWTNQPFGFAVSRKTGDPTPLFNSTTTGLFNGLVFQDQYIEISTQLPQQPTLYGLGEHVNHLLLQTNGPPLTMWARDVASPFNENVYGSHPFYLEMRGGLAHGVFLKNSNAMDVLLRPGVLTYRIIGGMLDFYVFSGGTPEQTIQQYQEVVGLPHMPPFWALGWHQCRWGYGSLAQVEAVVASYQDHGLPLDAMWTDIDYMNKHLDFTFDPVQFPVAEVQDFVTSLHQNGKRYVVIVDPGIHPQPGYAVYDAGKAADVFIKNRTGQDYIGVVWPGTAVYPDFLNPATRTWWQAQISDFRNTVSIDGLWIDMNEPSNFCNTNDNPATCPPAIAAPRAAPGQFDANFPPYAIHNCGDALCALNQKTIDPDAVHFDGSLEYNVHNLYGTAEAIATATAWESLTNQRSFVLGRSTFAGAGAHEAHWLGDNWSQWPYLAVSIPGILAMNMFGVPLVGADICGFLGTTTEELCARWMELGAFYPFARNHNEKEAQPQEPYQWASVAAISRKVLGARYSILSYLNSLFFSAHLIGGTVARPLFFEFPSDASTLPIDAQFMLGPALLVSPCLTQGDLSVDLYLPTASPWFNFWTWEREPLTGFVEDYLTPLDHIPVHIRGGAILPMQNSSFVMSTAALEQAEFYMVVAPGSGVTREAYGELYMDDGVSLDTSKYFYGQFVFANQTFTTSPLNMAYPAADGYTITTIYFLDVDEPPVSVTLLGTPLPDTDYVYNAERQWLAVTVHQSLTDVFSVAYTT